MADEKRRTKDGRYVLRPGEYERTKKKGFEFKYRDEFGHQHTLGAMTLQELREKEKAVRRDKDDGISTAKQRKTLNDYYSLWKYLKKDDLKSNTYSNYCWMYDTFASQTIGKMQVKDIKETDVQLFYKDLRDKGLAVNTLDNIQTVLHQVFKEALKDDAVRRNVFDEALGELKRKNPRKKKKALTPEELARFRECIADSVWYPVFTVLSWTGMRVGEIAGLTWDDIDYEQGVIHIRRTLVYYKDQTTGKMERKINTTKTVASFRDVPMNQHIIDALKYQKENCPECVAVIDGVSGFVFSTRFKDAQNQQCLNKAIRRISKDANNEKDVEVMLPYFSCHTLRRTHATNLARAGVNQAVTMYLMGHSDISTTIEVYTDVQKDMAAQGDEMLRAWLNGQNVAEGTEHEEFEELRHMADEAIRVKEAVQKTLEETGYVSAHQIEKLAKHGITFDELSEQ